MSFGAGEIAVILIVVVAFGAFLLWGNRPTPDRFAAANKLTLDDETRANVAAALRRTYRGRVFGATAGFGIAVVIAALGATRLNFTGGLAAMFAGALLGIALAQFTRSPATDAVRVASLEARQPNVYRPRHATLTLAIALVVLLGYGTALVVSYDVNAARAIVTAVVAGTVGLMAVVLGSWLQRRIVEQAQDRRDPESTRVDNALRSAAVRAVHHSVLGILLCGIALLGVTGATKTDRLEIVRAGKTVMTLPSGATDVVLNFSPERTQVTWVDPGGTPQSADLPPQRNPAHELVNRTSSGISDISPVVGIGFWLAFVAGIGALFEWRAAARSWRRPTPRRRRDIAPPSVLTAPGGHA